jgi:putative sigma-54 modulation protein
MSLLGHESFFVFFNAETNRINVLYRRRDGSYGLIEPEVD